MAAGALAPLVSARGEERGAVVACPESKVSGTYFAEQRSSDAYDLTSVVLPRMRDSPVIPRKCGISRTKLRGQRFNESKCTLLPALSSLDALLASQLSPEQTLLPPELVDEDLRLPALLGQRTLPANRQPPAFRAARRLYPGRCTDEAESFAAAPSDEEFREWLTLPGAVSKGFVATPGSSVCSHRSSSSKTRPPPQPKSPLPPMREVPEASTATAGGADAMWHMMMMRSTFEEPGVTPEFVAETLRDVLGITMEAARLCVKDTQLRMLAVIYHCADRAEVFRKVQLLRKKGLVIQVASPAGIPFTAPPEVKEPADSMDRGRGGKGADWRAQKQVSTQHYSELFEKTLKGTDCFALRRQLPPLLLAQARGKPGEEAPQQADQDLPAGATGGRPGRRTHTKRWRGEGASVAISILPEDPVAAVLENDKDFRSDFRLRRSHFIDAALGDASGSGDCADDGGAHDSDSNQPAVRASLSLSGLLSKHKGMLKRATMKTATVSSDTDAEGSKESTFAATTSEGRAASSSGGLGTQAATDGSASAGMGIFAAARLWGTVLESILPKQEVTQDRREACQMLRFFTFGAVGNEKARTMKDRDQVFYENVGSRDKVRMLYNLWMRLDEDGSGRVDILEFRAFAEEHMRERLECTSPTSAAAALPPWAQMRTAEDMPRFIQKLCDKLAHLLLGKKSSFTIEDMMRLIWPCAQAPDIREMRKMCREFAKSIDRRRVKTPPVLPDADFEGLCSVFRYFDEDQSGSVMMDELLSKGLIYEDQAPQFLKEWDKNGDGSLDLLEFCEMMCPSGFRAHVKSTVGSRSDGQRVLFDPKMECWRTTESPDEPEPVEG